MLWPRRLCAASSSQVRGEWVSGTLVTWGRVAMPGSGPAWGPTPGWACSGRRPAPALSHELAQACVPVSGRLPPVPGAWRTAALEGRSPAPPETGHPVPGWAEGEGLHGGRVGASALGGAFPMARACPGGSALFSGHPDAFAGTLLCHVGGGQATRLHERATSQGPECVRWHPGGHRCLQPCRIPLAFRKILAKEVLK